HVGHVESGLARDDADARKRHFGIDGAGHLRGAVDAAKSQQQSAQQDGAEIVTGVRGKIEHDNSPTNKPGAPATGALARRWRSGLVRLFLFFLLFFFRVLVFILLVVLVFVLLVVLVFVLMLFVLFLLFRHQVVVFQSMTALNDKQRIFLQRHRLLLFFLH